ncbi:MAG: hypothetical protein RPR40_02565 [Bermanella sp.]
MDKLNRREIAHLLGVYAPYRVKDMVIDSEQEVLTVLLEEHSSKVRGIFSSPIKKSTGNKISWHHSKTGRFSTVIEIAASASIFSRSRTLNPPAFLGAQDSNYTYQLQQTILLAASKKLDAETISALTGVDRQLIAQIIGDADNAQQDQQAQNLLPLETDPVWRAIIKHEISFKTNLAPLKFLIARLELTYANNKQDPSVIQDSVATLRQFFIKYRSQLKSEYAQVGVNLQAPAAEVKAKKSNKRISLNAEHPIWNNILTGNIDLLSKNTGLNLYITQLKSLYRKGDNSDHDKHQIAKELLFYLKKNMAKLKPELQSISRIVNQMGEVSTQQSIPGEDSPVWTRLLDGQFNIESQQMAFKLLLVKARSNENTSEAVAQIRQYFSRNSRMLENELRQIEQQLAIAS